MTAFRTHSLPTLFLKPLSFLMSAQTCLFSFELFFLEHGTLYQKSDMSPTTSHRRNFSRIDVRKAFEPESIRRWCSLNPRRIRRRFSAEKPGRHRFCGLSFSPLGYESRAQARLGEKSARQNRVFAVFLAVAVQAAESTPALRPSRCA